MTTVTELKARMQAPPFKPCRIHTTDGKTCDIVHHRLMFVKRHRVEVALDLDSNSVPERFAKVAPLHLTALEDPATAAP